VDVHEWPACLYRYKIDPSAKFDDNKSPDIIRTLLTNFVLATLPMTTLFIYAYSLRGCQLDGLPTLAQVVQKIGKIAKSWLFFPVHH
jgi:hypothetical protein